MNERQVKAFHYYQMGLNSVEIGKLTGYSPRTVQTLAQRGQWLNALTSEKTPIEKRVLKLKETYTAKEIAERLKRSKRWVWTTLKNAKSKNE